MNSYPLRAVTLILLLSPVFPAWAQEGAKSRLILESVKIEPASPKPETLCRLTVTLRNAGDRQASGMEFGVKINGREVPAYKNRLYLQPIAPGATREIRLYNFWSTESGRPAPADGKLNVEVTLHRAVWMGKESQGGANVWTPLGAADGLPVTKSLALALGRLPR